MKTSIRLSALALGSMLAAVALSAQTGNITSGNTTGNTTGGNLTLKLDDDKRTVIGNNTTSGNIIIGNNTTSGGNTTTGGNITIKPDDDKKPVISNNTTGGNTTIGNNTTGNNTTGNNTTASRKGPSENASETAKSVHTVITSFQASRDAYLADRAKLLEDLKKATTDAERQKILEALRQDNAAREAEERNLGKQIREELKQLRQSRKTGG